MLDAVHMLVAAFACALAVPAAVVFLQAMASLIAPNRGKPCPERPRPSAAVLVPAHNEAIGIAATVAAVRAQMHVGDRLLVVADNCTDDTATVAAAAGADVVVRSDPERRGKGYALDFGVHALAPQPPSVLVIIDADCALGEGCLDSLVRECAFVKRPVQALYLMHSPADAGRGARLGELAWLLRNWARPLGWHRLGFPCQLMGTGMAFPYEPLRTMPLATGNIVEDLRLGIDFAAAGSPPVFFEHAQVHSTFPSRTVDLQTQRKRWELGHLATIKQGVPRLVVEAVRQRRPALLAMALDLSVPPLALLVLMLVLVGVSSTLLGLFGQPVWPAMLAVAAFSMVAAAVLLTWRRFGRGVVTLAELLAVPVYMLAKLPTYLHWLLRRKMGWVRTARDAEPPPGKKSEAKESTS
jgi:cellulose synthase/poly-beta-1,6-N-acetylglucosamine synthase-like glycosyltransferase